MEGGVRVPAAVGVPTHPCVRTRAWAGVWAGVPGSLWPWPCVFAVPWWRGPAECCECVCKPVCACASVCMHVQVCACIWKCVRAYASVQWRVQACACMCKCVHADGIVHQCVHACACACQLPHAGAAPGSTLRCRVPITPPRQGRPYLPAPGWGAQLLCCPWDPRPPSPCRRGTLSTLPPWHQHPGVPQAWSRPPPQPHRSLAPARWRCP